MTESHRIIRASEIGQWVYCQRAWLLARQGYENKNVAALRSGRTAHQQHSRRVARAWRLRFLAFIFFALAAALLLVFLFLR